MGLTEFLFANKKAIKMNKTISFENDSPAVNLMQSPKHPHSFTLPVITAYPVRKVKKIINIKSSQLKRLNCHPKITATPAMISNAIIRIDSMRV